MKVHVSPEVLALLGTLLGAALSAAAEAIARGGANIDWATVATAAVVAGAAAYTQSHHPSHARPG